VASTVAKRMRRAYHLADPLGAQADLEALARELDPAPTLVLRAASVKGWLRPSRSVGWACHPPWPGPYAAPTASSR
jgi:hypothetical protein